MCRKSKAEWIVEIMVDKKTTRDSNGYESLALDWWSPMIHWKIRDNGKRN